MTEVPPSPDALREAIAEAPPPVAPAPAPEVAPPAPAAPIAPTPEPPIPEPLPRRDYLRPGRSFGFPFGPKSTFVQGNYYRRTDGSLSVDGLLGDLPYDTTDDLLAKAGWDPATNDALVARLRALINEGQMS